ncbi:Variable outer membrane protein [Borrelia duttonii CR2A]|uniref:Variable large protein n=1 Tax=Borrelia duttonii CR2A TaxID=1432657 RepID=W6TEZ1_9SPIR|nr:Variable outer membrane protein [Borrelia duttonii CR2A]
MMVMMGCNSGGVLEAEQGKNKFLQSLVNVSNEFLNVFTSFGEMVGSVLGLKVDSKNSDVGNYFKKVQGTVQGTKDGLNKIVSEMRKEGNPNLAATESAVNKLVSEALDKIIEGAKEASEAIGIAGDELLGNVAAAGSGGVVGDGVEKIVKGIKGIVEVVLKGVGNADAGDSNKASDGAARTANAGEGEAGKLFSSGNAGEQANAKKVATDAAKAVGGVRGADILQAMIKDKAKTLANTSAAQAVQGDAKDGTIAGAIALRAMAKDGKFAGPNAATAEYAPAVKGAAVVQ